MEILIHYDEMVRKNPMVGPIVRDALQGDVEPLNKALELLKIASPTNVRFLTSALGYVAEGQQVFIVGSKFQQLLLNTEADNVPLSRIRLPYKFLYLALPNCPWRIWGGLRTGMHKIVGAYLISTNKNYAIMAWAKANHASIDKTDDATFSISFNLSKIPRLPNDPDAVDLEQFTKKLMTGDFYESSDIGMALGDAPPKLQNEHRESVQALVRVASNFILYLNSINAETTRVMPEFARKGNKAKRKRAAKEDAKLGASQARITWVGASFESASRKASSPVQAGQHEASQQGSATWTYRRGHFHHYWVGPKKDADGNPQLGTERVLRWIEPQRRDMAQVVEASARPHKVRHFA